MKKQSDFAYNDFVSENIFTGVRMAVRGRELFGIR